LDRPRPPLYGEEKNGRKRDSRNGSETGP